MHFEAQWVFPLEKQWLVKDCSPSGAWLWGGEEWPERSALHPWTRGIWVGNWGFSKERGLECHLEKLGLIRTGNFTRKESCVKLFISERSCVTKVEVLCKMVAMVNNIHNVFMCLEICLYVSISFLVSSVVFYFHKCFQVTKLHFIEKKNCVRC